MNNLQSDNLRQRAVAGTSWRLVSVIVQFSSQFIVGVVLARLLPPEDFGLLGLAMIAVGFSELFVDLGIGPAIIQRQHLTTRHIRVGFSISVVAGCLLTLLVYSIAVPVSHILNDLRVTEILQVLSFTFLITGFGIMSVSLLTRQLAFKQLLVVDIVSYLMGYGCVAIVLAVQGYGVWSLVYGTFVQISVNALLAFLLVHHPVKPLVSKVEFKDLINFGTGVSLAKVVNYFAKQGDYFVVGRVLGPGPLGLYLRAYQLMQLPLRVLVVRVAATVLFPVISQIQAERERVSRIYLESISLITLITMPCIAVLIILAPEFINGIYGSEWREAAPILQLLLLFAIFQIVYYVAYQFVQAMGHIYWLFLCQAAYGLAVFLGSWYAAVMWGIIGVAIAVGLSICLMFVLVVTISNRLTNTSLGQFLRAHLPAVIVALPTAITCFVVRVYLLRFGLADLWVLLLAGGLSFLTAGLVWYYLPSRELSALHGIITRLLADNSSAWLASILPRIRHRAKVTR